MIEWLAAATLIAGLDCAPPEGTAALLDRPERIIIIGEMHGTAETPAAFAETVCAAALRGPVTVALELPAGMQPQIDAFLTAPDEPTALVALEDTPFRDPRMDDGRTSEAMWAMLNRVRLLKADGRDVAISLFQPSSSRQKGLDQSWYELDMGYLLAGAFHARPEARVLALVGNLHARNTGFERFPDVGLPAAAHLPTADTLTIDVVGQGGDAWNCQPECGSHPASAAYDAQARGFILEADVDGAYDGILALGPTTASPPLSQRSAD